MEFQAVVLCGTGRRLTPITTGTCKALLPVGNKPLVQHAIEWCDKAGFGSTIIAVTEDDYDQVEAACHAFELKVSMFRVPNGTEAGQVLKLLEEANVLAERRDLAVLPCDFLTDIEPETLISSVRSQEDNMGVAGFVYRNTAESLDIATLNPDVLLHSVSATDPRTEYLLDSYGRQQIKEAKLLKPRMAMLWQFPQVVATMDRLSSSILFIRRAVLAFEGLDFNKPLNKLIRDVARRTWCHRVPYETVVMQSLPENSSFIRANNLPAYMEANRQKLREHARTQQPVKQREPGQAAVGNDSILGPNTTVGERSSVKRTAIGQNCQIGKKCRLNGCVILDNVTIGNEVSLENCLIGKGAIVEQKSKLIGCSVEGGYSVVSETEAKNEVLKGLSMEGIDEEEFDDIYESISSDSTASDDETQSELEDAGGFDEDDDFFDRS